MKMRNIASLNTTVPLTLLNQIPCLIKLFNLTQNFNIKYDLARSVKLNFSSNTRSIIDEPEGKIDTQVERDALRDSILTFGRPTMYHHQYDVRYTVPINKFPLTDWVSLTLNYSGTYDWNAGSMALVNDSINLGNVIQNTNKKRINAQLNMNTLYNKVPFIKNLNAGPRNSRGGSKNSRSDSRSVPKDSKAKNNSSDKEDSDEEDEEEKNNLDRIVNVFSHFARMAFSVKNVNISYDETNGSMLPGFKPTSEFFGMAQRFSPNSAPGWRYLLGDQPEESDLNRFASNGWITSDTLLNQPLLNNIHHA